MFIFILFYIFIQQLYFDIDDKMLNLTSMNSLIVISGVGPMCKPILAITVFFLKSDI